MKILLPLSSNTQLNSMNFKNKNDCNAGGNQPFCSENISYNYANYVSDITGIMQFVKSIDKKSLKS